MMLDDLGRVLESCLSDALVFERDASGGALFEVDSLKKEQKEWLVVAAGVSRDESSVAFPRNPARAERATIPLNVLGGGRASFFFVLRPLQYPIENAATFSRAAHFAPRDGIPLVEIREAYFCLWDLPGDESQLKRLRWELDLTAANQNPIETWLQPWKDRIQYNPGHPPSHLHFNPQPPDIDAAWRDRDEQSQTDLRLAVGLPNPLALILSLATWLRQQ
jgi:hypothetical protein